MAKKLFKIFNWRITKHDLIMWFLIGLVGYISWWVNNQRVVNGFFTSPNWIYLDGLLYTVLSALIVGYVVSEVINWGKK